MFFELVKSFLFTVSLESVQLLSRPRRLFTLSVLFEKKFKKRKEGDGKEDWGVFSALALQIALLHAEEHAHVSLITTAHSKISTY